MNKLRYYIAALFLMIALGANAQTTEGTPEANFSIYKNKLKKSEEQKSIEKKNTNSKFWMSRAILMMDIFELHRTHLPQGQLELHVKILYPDPLETKEFTDEEGNQMKELDYERITILFKNGKLESFTDKEILYDTPLPEALHSLEKVQELDVDGKLEKKVSETYVRLKQNFERLAIEEFFKPEYEASFAAFSAVADINEKPIMGGAIDTTLLYYAGMAASRAEMNDEAIKYYGKAIAADTQEEDVYVFIKQKYFAKGDTARGVEYLEKGFKRFPNNQTIVIELINYYLMAGRQDEALDYLHIAQKDDPENLSFIFAEATLYDKTGQVEKALETYKRCTEIDPEYFNAYYNIGVMFYNTAVEAYKAAESITVAKEYGEATDAADEILKKSLPYMEKAHEIDAEERSTMETLKTLYYRTKDMEKYEEIKAILDALPAVEENSGIN